MNLSNSTDIQDSEPSQVRKFIEGFVAGIIILLFVATIAQWLKMNRTRKVRDNSLVQPTPMHPIEETDPHKLSKNELSEIEWPISVTSVATQSHTHSPVSNSAIVPMYNNVSTGVGVVQVTHDNALIAQSKLGSPTPKNNNMQ